MKMRIFGFFLTLTQGQEWVSVQGKTIGECLEDLIRQFPGARKKLFDEKGKLYTHVAIFLNGRLMTGNDLTAPVKETDALSMMPQIGGG
jgi:molybdopterin synthase sulfur carrier subunit